MTDGGHTWDRILKDKFPPKRQTNTVNKSLGSIGTIATFPAGGSPQLLNVLSTT